MKIAVIGAGTMGAGIAQVFASAGHDVLLCDIRAELTQRGRSMIEKSLRRQVEKGKLATEAADAALARVTPGISSDAADCALILEAAAERMDIKRAIFTELDKLCPPGTVFASNTSSLSLTEMGLGLSRPVVGMHFFNPAPVMSLVEVISGLTTPEDLADRVFALARSLGKEPVRVREAPGFVVNRILIPMVNEAVCVLSEGVADAESIDQAMKLGANHPLGPLALADLIGLDVVLSICEVLQRETGDDKYRPCPLLRQMVRAGRLGRKSGAGFYSYS